VSFETVLRPLAWAALLLLASCASQRPIVPPPLELPNTAQTAQAASDGPQQGSTRIERVPGPQALQPKTKGSEKPPLQPPVGGGESAAVNLSEVTLGTFAQLVFGDLLKRNVNVDAQVMARKDLVTFRSGPTQNAAQVESAAKLLLKSYGVAVIDLGNLVRVVPDSGNTGTLPEIRRGTALPETPMPLRPVFQLVELTAVRQTEVAGWLKTMFGDRVKAQEDAQRNALLLSATPDTMEAALEAIRVLDQPVMAGTESLAITPVYWSADELARRLYEVLTAQGYAVQPLNQQAGGVRYPVIVLPVSGLNTVYVFARGATVLTQVANWAKTLDRPNERGVGKNFFTYAVKHIDAAVLAQTLEQLLSNSGSHSTSGSTTTGGAGASTAGNTAAQNTSGFSGSRVVVDKGSNMLIFQASQDEYSQLNALLQTLDRPSKSALIEVTVAELSNIGNSQLGIEWLLNHTDGEGRNISGGTLGGLQLGNSGANFRVLNRLGDVRLVLNALATDNKASILSSPRVLARNGETATIQVGSEVPIITQQQQTYTGTTTGTVPGVLQSIQYRNTGVILRVKPVIHSGDQIDLDVTQEVSAAQSTDTGVSASPTFSTRKIDTKLTLKNGATVLLGGLISDEDNSGNSGVPGLKDIPLLGQLFSRQTTSKNRRELIVLITPYVVNDNEDAEAVTQAFRNMLGPWSDNTAPGSLHLSGPASVPGIPQPLPSLGGASPARPAPAPAVPAAQPPASPASH
jgi:general secretion pathway protein D